MLYKYNIIYLYSYERKSAILGSRILQLLETALF